MARIPEHELDRIKREVSLEELARGRGMSLEKEGADLVGLCWAHDDHSPSLRITPAKNLFHCMACGAGGSVIDFVMQLDGLPFRDAVEQLLPQLPGGWKEAAPGASCPLSVEMNDEELLAAVVAHYASRIEDAAGYLKRRGLEAALGMEDLALGFCDGSLRRLLPSRDTKRYTVLCRRLQELGVLRPSGHEHFGGMVVFPIFDAEGHVVQIYGRRADACTALRHQNLKGPVRGVWNQAALAGQEEVILCEAVIDALTFRCAGFSNVTATLGTEAFTEDHMAALQRLGTKRVILAFDADRSGEAGAKKVAAKLLAAGIGAYRVDLPKGMDVNAYALKVKPAEKSLGLLLQSAWWMGSGPPPPRTPSLPKPLEIPITIEPALRQSSGQPAGEEALAHVPVNGGQKAALVLPPVETTSLPAAGITPGVSVSLEGEDVFIAFGERRYRARGLQKNTSFDTLKVNLFVERKGAFHQDVLDLYVSRYRQGYIKQAALEIQVEEEVIKRDMGTVLRTLEELVEKRLTAALAPKETKVVLTPEEEAAALGFLQSPDLLGRIRTDAERCGIVGEAVNVEMLYLIGVSRLLPRPLAGMVQSTTAAGKSTVMAGALSFVPEEEKVVCSALTEKALFYIGETKDLRHKVFVVEEQEGASRATYALKLFQSEGKLSIISTGKDPDTGRFVPNDYQAEGPVALLMTTPGVEVDEELLNRCVTLTMNETREQTRAIHRLQRQSRTLLGWKAESEREEIQKLHQNAQRLLSPLRVVNLYANELTFLDAKTRTRRDHEKYLTIIDAIALLRQHQKPRRTALRKGKEEPYVEVDLHDIEEAGRIAKEVLGRTLDEMPAHTRKVLREIEGMVEEGCREQAVEQPLYRFRARDVRERTGLGAEQIRIHLQRLVELEYLLVHRGPRGQSHVYELVYDGSGEEGRRFVIGLIDVEELRRREEGPQTRTSSRGLQGQKARLQGQKARLQGSIRPQSGPNQGGIRTPLEAPKALSDNASSRSGVKTAKNTDPRAPRSGCGRSAGGRSADHPPQRSRSASQPPKLPKR